MSPYRLLFCRRGREGQRTLKTTSFKFEVDPTGRNYATMVHDEATKNHPGGIANVPSSERSARMYEIDHVNDSYKALKLHMSKSNQKSESFFQYPIKKELEFRQNIWYEAFPVGVSPLNSIMKSISEAASLSKLYTKHSVRATAITLWSKAEIPNRYILAISGHCRNEQGLAHCNTHPSTSQNCNFSELLSNSLVNGTT